MERKEMDFAVFCIESIADRLKLNGTQVYEMLTEASDILDTYIVAHFEPLHTQGREYIVNDILEFMEEEGLLK